MDADQALLEKARQYDPDALAEVYDLYSAGIYRYAIRLLGDADLAEECVAETFSRFLGALKNGGGPRQYLRAYLYRSAHNWITDRYRRPGPTEVLLDLDLPCEESGPERSFEEAAEADQVRLALHSLTPDQRQVILLRYVEDWSNTEIAQSLEKPVGAVKALQHRAINALRRYFANESSPKDGQLPF